ncbi:MAG: Sapep family Mn(2+)-dependent dipeptidase [Clostridia bacterium]|nr:Sapep family Mn(2+)-dependent dipeptidase [Clostridia bacterium]
MEKYLPLIKNSLKKVIQIPSVEDAPQKNMPFGKGVYDALNYVLDLAKDLGFETKNYDNYIGEVIWGEGEEMAILTHLDVVPVGKESDWIYPPFSGEEVDGKIYGRGTMDDKGPAIVCLYCMKALKDEGFIPNKKIKLILGCNEESGWRCIDHYNKVAKMPEFGFSPDADFPVLYAEKGILHVGFYFDNDLGLENVEGGDRINVVCDKCQAIAPFIESLANVYGVKSEDEKLVTYGKTAHGSTPQKGVNAIHAMVCYLESLGLITSKIREYLFEDKLSLTKISDDTGNLTMSPDVISVVGDKILVKVDIRYPSTYDGEKLKKQLEEIAPFDVLSHQLPLYNDKESFLVKTLLNIFNETMGTNFEPMAIGGGTYARALKMGTAFGPEMPGEESTIHQPNEYVSIENLKLQFTMYKKAIKELTK